MSGMLNTSMMYGLTKGWEKSAETYKKESVDRNTDVSSAAKSSLKPSNLNKSGRKTSEFRPKSYKKAGGFRAKGGFRSKK